MVPASYHKWLTICSNAPIWLTYLGGLTLSIVEIGGDGDNGMGDSAAQVLLGGLLHLGEDHGGDLLGGESLAFTLGRLDIDMGLLALLDQFEGEEFLVGLDALVVEQATHKTFGIEDSVLGVGSKLILGGVSNQTFALLGKGHIGRGDTVTLVVGDDFNTTALVDADT